MSFRHQRKWHELVVDPYTPFAVGRLLGANEMAVALLRKEDNETAKHVAEVLAQTSAFFMEKVPQTSLPVPRKP